MSGKSSGKSSGLPEGSLHGETSHFTRWSGTDSAAEAVAWCVQNFIATSWVSVFHASPIRNQQEPHRWLGQAISGWESSHTRQWCEVHFGEVGCPGCSGAMRQESTWEEMESGKLCSALTGLWKQTNQCLLKEAGTSLVVQWLRLHLPMQRVWVQSLLRELRLHME